MKRPFFVAVFVVLVALTEAVVMPVFADTSWIVGTGGTALTALSLDTTAPDETRCGDILGTCSDLTVGSNSVHWNHVSGYGADNNAGIVVYLPASESNMSIIDEFDIHVEFSHPSGGGITVHGVDSRDGSYCTLATGLPGGTTDYGGSDPCPGNYVDGLIVFCGALEGYTCTVTISVSGHSVDTESSLGGENAGILAYNPNRPVTEADTLSVSSLLSENDDIVTTKDAYVHSVIGGTVTILEQGGLNYLYICNATHCALYRHLNQIYVTDQQTVEPGCVIGMAGDPAQGALALNTPVSKSEFYFRVYPYPEGDDLDWTDWPDPTSNDICQDVSTPNCLTNNPHLTNQGAGWADGGTNPLLFYSVARSEGQIKITGKAYIYQQLTLTPDTDYYVTITAAPGFSLTDANFTTAHISLGDDTVDVDVEKLEGAGPYAYRTVTSTALHPVDPDFGENTFTLKIGPADPKVGLNLTLVCLHTADSTVQAPSACYFVGSGFDESSGWTLGGGAEDQGGGVQGLHPSLGSVKIPVDGWITRPLEIAAWDDKPLVFQIQVDATLYGPGIEDIGTTNSVTMQASFDDGTTVTDYPAWTVKNSATSIRYTTNVIVSTGTEMDGDFYLRVTDFEGAGAGAQVGRVCLENKSGNHWPGYEEYDIPPDGNFAVVCTECLMPSDGEPLWNLKWLAYLGCLLRNLIYCTLLGLFNNVIEFVRGFATAIGYVILWLSATVQSLFRAVLAWLIAQGLSFIIGFINSPIGKFLWDVIELGNLVFGILLEIADYLIVALIKFIVLTGVMLQSTVVFWQGIQSAYNGSPAGVTFFSCATNDPLVNVCIGLGLVDSAMEDIPALGWLGLAASGVYTVHTIMWVIRQITAGVDTAIGGV